MSSYEVLGCQPAWTGAAQGVPADWPDVPRLGTPTLWTRGSESSPPWTMSVGFLGSTFPKLELPISPRPMRHLNMHAPSCI